jgi:hypothetical protein
MNKVLMQKPVGFQASAAMYMRFAIIWDLSSVEW